MSSLTVMAWPRTNATHNPYNARLYDAVEMHDIRVIEFSIGQALLGRFDIVHLHWPDGLLKNASVMTGATRLMALLSVLTFVKIVRRKKVVWTVHNLRPHNGAHPFLQRMLHLVLDSTVDGYLLFSEASARRLPRLHRRFGRKMSAMTDHGSYADDYAANDLSLVDAVAGSETVVIGHLGHIERYKGPLELTQAFSVTLDDKLRLLIAGECRDASLRRDLQRLADADKRVILRFGWLSAAQLGTLVRACQLVAYPYREILNSGSVFLPLSLGRPVIVPATETFQELAHQVGAGWVHHFDGVITARDLQAALATGTPEAPPNMRSRTWPLIAEYTCAFYRQLAGRRRGAPVGAAARFL